MLTSEGLKPGRAELLADLLNSELSQHAELVQAVPALYDLTLFRETEDTYACDRDPSAGGRDSPELACVGDVQRPAGHHFVPFPDHVLHDVLDLREGGAVLLDELLDVFGAALQSGAVGLVGEIRLGEDLVRDVQLLVLQTSSMYRRKVSLFLSTDIPLLLSSGAEGQRFPS